MKCTEQKKGFTDGIALMVVAGEIEWAERIDAELKKAGFVAGCQDNDDDQTEITYCVPRGEVAFFKKVYKEVKAETK